MFKKLIVIVMSCATVMLTAQLSLPNGFISEIITEGTFEDPTNLALAPDGRLFITEKNGRIRIIEEGLLLEEPFYEFETETPGERGLAGMVFHPNFEQNQKIYIYYTVKDSDQNRLLSVTANGNGVVPGSEEIIMDFDPMWAAWHNGGAMVFDQEGFLYIAIGDGTAWNLSQNINSTLGKVLRLNTDGSIPLDNPFVDQTEGIHEAIWALGLRNPFSMAIQNSTGKIFVNDVGNELYEEVDELVEGGNYGWGLIEGPIQDGQNPPENYQDPIYYYHHSEGCAIVGADFYEPEVYSFPEFYHNKYFFADLCLGWLGVMDPETHEVSTMIEGLDHPVSIQFNDEGEMYLLEIIPGRIVKISYTGTGAPYFIEQPQSAVIPVGENVTFSALAVGDGIPVYQWHENDIPILGANSISYIIENPSLSYDGNIYHCEIENPFGSAVSNNATLTVIDGSRPDLTIISPDAESLYTAGDTLYFSAEALDAEDGELSESHFTWDIDFHHDLHSHPAMAPVSGISNGIYVIPNAGEVDTNVFYRVKVEVLDNDGLLSSKNVDIHPNKSTINFASNLEGAKFSIDGVEVLAGESVRSVSGLKRTIETFPYQILNHWLYDFENWENGSEELTQSFFAKDTVIIANFGSLHEYITGSNIEHVVANYYSGIGEDKEFFRSEELDVIDENWSIIGPYFWEGFPVDSFGVEYVGSILAPYSGAYKLFVYHDGLSDLYIEDSLVISNTFDNYVIGWDSATVDFDGGEFYNFRLVYENYDFKAKVRFAWKFSIIERQIIPQNQLFLSRFHFPNENKFDLFLFPNPTKNEIFIQVSQSVVYPNGFVGTYEIRNLNGQLIMNGHIEFSISHRSGRIDVSRLEKGVYNFRLKSERDSHSLTFIKI